MSVEDLIKKEERGLKMEDFSTELQNYIRSKISPSQFTIMEDYIVNVANALGPITITIGTTGQRAANPVNGRNIHINMEENWIECYIDGVWRPNKVVFK